jgi:hypothetical protein
VRPVQYTYEIYSGGEPSCIQTSSALAGIEVGQYLQLQDEGASLNIANTFRIEAIESLILHGKHLTNIEQKVLVFCKPEARSFAK